MKKREITENISGKRLMGLVEACQYCGLGRTAMRSFGERVNAIVKIGGRVLYDKIALDKAIDGMEEAIR